MDPIELRRKNIISGIRDVDKSDATNLDKQPILLGEVIDIALKESGYYGPKNDGVGRGIAITEHGQIGFEGHAAVHIYPEGKILANMSTFDPGMGTGTILAQVLSEELGIPIEEIEVQAWDTENGFRDQGVGGSRGARVTSIAGYEAAQDLINNLKRLAAEFYGWDEDSIIVGNGKVAEAEGQRGIPFEELAHKTGERITGEGHIDEGWGNQFVSYAAHVAEVLVDRETGEITLQKYCSVQETGTVLNPIGFQGQIEGGILQGIGQALMEHVNLEQGQVINPSFADYKIPVIADIPGFKSLILESEQGHGPYNVRGIGEGAITMPCPAIMNAIQDACGVRINDLPATSEKVYRQLKQGL
jgi:CO/xanthine dehydrogenase Mo-binding subunit